MGAPTTRGRNTASRVRVRVRARVGVKVGAEGGWAEGGWAVVGQKVVGRRVVGQRELERAVVGQWFGEGVVGRGVHLSRTVVVVALLGAGGVRPTPCTRCKPHAAQYTGRP